MAYETMNSESVDPLSQHICTLLRSSWYKEDSEAFWEPTGIFSMAMNIAFLVRQSGATIENPNQVSILVTMVGNCTRVTVVAQSSTKPTSLTVVVDFLTDPDSSAEGALRLLWKTVDKMVNEVLDTHEANRGLFLEHQSKQD